MADQEGRLSTADKTHRLILLRHGETAWSRDKKHTGRTEIDLTPIGEEQARDLHSALGAIRPALVLCSPSGRARRTAELAGLTELATGPAIELTIEPDLLEWDYGDFEGMTTAEIREQGRPDWAIWTGEVPGGESIAEVTERADRVIERIAAAITGGDVVVVGHGHLNRVIAARWIGLPAVAGQHLWLDTGTVCVLGFEHDHRAIQRWNLPAIAAASAL